MIQDVSRIEKEFLIRSIVQSEQPVRFHGISASGTGLITTMDQSMLSVTLIDMMDDAPFCPHEHVTGYFDCNGRTYAFETMIRDSRQNELRLDPPGRLLKSLQRKYVRVRKPRDIQVSISLPNEEICLDYPVCPDYVSLDKPSSRAGYQGKNIAEIVNSFKTDIGNKSSIDTIVMFRTKKPDLFEEKLICDTGRVLFIPSTSSGLPKVDPYPEGRIITLTQEEKFEDPNYFVEGSRFDKLLEEKKKDAISSEIWCPIVYYQYVVGYVYAAHTGGESFDVSMVDRLWDFSRILASELKKTGYFDSETKVTETRAHKPEILDMSPGGMLITLPERDIRTPIKEGSTFTTNISFGKKAVQCAARVVRRYEGKDVISYGTTFLDLAPQDIMNLYEFLYRRPYTNDDPVAYEQINRA
jgi:hypothetical protein